MVYSGPEDEEGGLDLDLGEMFEMFDADGSGFIDFDEFRAMLYGLGLELNDAKALKYFKNCDTDGSGGAFFFCNAI